MRVHRVKYLRVQSTTYRLVVFQKLKILFDRPFMYVGNGFPQEPLIGHFCIVQLIVSPIDKLKKNKNLYVLLLQTGLQHIS